MTIILIMICTIIIFTMIGVIIRFDFFLFFTQKFQLFNLFIIQTIIPLVVGNHTYNSKSHKNGKK